VREVVLKEVGPCWEHNGVGYRIVRQNGIVRVEVRYGFATSKWHRTDLGDTAEGILAGLMLMEGRPQWHRVTGDE